MQHAKKVRPKAPAKDTGIISNRKWKRGQKNKWLPKLRELSGKSQGEFAAMVGVKRNTIIYIENGRRKLDAILARKIRAATGVFIWTHLFGDDRVLGGDGKAYTRKDFDDWKKDYIDRDDKSLEAFLETAKDTLQLMLRAAKACGGPKNRLPALKLSFNDWCCDQVKKFHLEKPLKEILKRERHYWDELTMNYRDWRAKGMDGYRQLYRFKDDPKKSEDELLTLRVHAWPLWGQRNLKAPPGNIKKMHLRLPLLL